MATPGLRRRQFLRTGLLFSASLMVPRPAWPQPPSPDALHLFCLGDWGTHADVHQTAVARALQEYARAQAITPQALVLLGDNFYGHLAGTDSPRWKAEFEDMYPASAFPGPCYAILGNHDYDDQPGGEEFQLAYARRPDTRWKMPGLWYRVELPARNPVVTLLCTNTHFAKLSPAEITTQHAWLEKELAAPRTNPWLIVCGHHPIMSCRERHIDGRLALWRKLFETHGVHAYLSGHEHDLQHLRAVGTFTDCLISGGGGRQLHPVNANSETQFARESFGFLHLALGTSGMNATFVGDDAAQLYSFERKISA